MRAPFLDLEGIERDIETNANIYMMAHRQGFKPNRNRIVDWAVNLNPLQMAYFCQQLATHALTTEELSECLNTFVNLLGWTPIVQEA